MNVITNYFLDELTTTMFYLDHSKPCDFYLSAWQRRRSAAPLLAVRALLFLASLGVTVTSLLHYVSRDLFGFWFIYLTHWGLVAITLATGFATAVSACYFFRSQDEDSESALPWYVKAYWVLYNTAVPVAFLISIFYWTVLYKANSEENDDVDYINIAVHGLNSVLMWLMLTTSSQPSRLLHVYQPLAFALAYFFFSFFYYLAGGLNAKGKPWVYHVIDWKKPRQTIIVGAFTGLMLMFIYFLVISVSLARDAVARRYVKSTDVRVGDETAPLRQLTNINNYV
ncbi:hypothetical protein ACJJTC_012682 [Scirpophaga incertulas]